MAIFEASSTGCDADKLIVGNNIAVRVGRMGVAGVVADTDTSIDGP